MNEIGMLQHFSMKREEWKGGEMRRGLAYTGTDKMYRNAHYSLNMKYLSFVVVPGFSFIHTADRRLFATKTCLYMYASRVMWIFHKFHKECVRRSFCVLCIINAVNIAQSEATLLCVGIRTTQEWDWERKRKEKKASDEVKPLRFSNDAENSK